MQESPANKSGEWQRPPPPAWKAWLAPGVIIALVMLAISFAGGYGGRKFAEGEEAAERKETARQIQDLKEQGKLDRENALSKERFEEYVRGRIERDNALGSVLQNILDARK